MAGTGGVHSFSRLVYPELNQTHQTQVVSVSGDQCLLLFCPRSQLKFPFVTRAGSRWKEHFSKEDKTVILRGTMDGRKEMGRRLG